MGPEAASRSEDGLDSIKSEDTTFAPINPPTTDEHNTPLQKERSNASKSVASKSLERSWSMNDGVSIGGHEVDEAAVANDDAAYTVSWEENDPKNPRNMNKARRWFIVCIVSMGSLCV